MAPRKTSIQSLLTRHRNAVLLGLAVFVVLALGTGSALAYVALRETMASDRYALQAQITQAKVRAEQADASFADARSSLEKANAEIDALEGRLAVTGADISGLVARWQPRVAFLYCERAEGAATGSGTAFLIDGTVQVVTNSHVVRDAKFCAAVFPEETEPYWIASADFVFATDGSDVAWLPIPDADPALRLTAAMPTICTEEPKLGDRLIVLGYPSVGSSISVTVTDGVVAGFDSDYFVTNAKIEHGNSGGAAVLVGEDCFLGIPTSVISGNIESFGRILKANTVF